MNTELVAAAHATIIHAEGSSRFFGVWTRKEGLNNPSDMNTSVTPKTLNTDKAKRRKYDEHFKRDAVALLEAGRGGTQLARELGVSI